MITLKLAGFVASIVLTFLAGVIFGIFLIALTSANESEDENK